MHVNRGFNAASFVELWADIKEIQNSDILLILQKLLMTKLKKKEFQHLQHDHLFY